MFDYKGGSMMRNDKKKRQRSNLWESEISERFCQNCGRKIKGYRNKNGAVKVSCPICDTFYNCQKISRRKEIVEINAPQGNELQ